MNELEKIAREIESIRDALHRLVLRKECALDDPAVIQLSEKLDVLIVRYQRCKIEGEEIAEEKGEITE